MGVLLQALPPLWALAASPISVCDCAAKLFENFHLCISHFYDRVAHHGRKAIACTALDATASLRRRTKLQLSSTTKPRAHGPSSSSHRPGIPPPPPQQLLAAGFAPEFAPALAGSHATVRLTAPEYRPTT